MKLPPGTRRVSTPRQIEAVSSPLRQELLEQLGHAGPASVAELASQMGRRPTALHYHVNLLLRAGILRRAGRRASGRRAEALYALSASRFVVVGTSAGGPGARRAAARTVAATLRLTQREAVGALLSGAAATVGGARVFHARRYRGALDEAALARVNRLLDALEAVLEGASRRHARRGARRREGEAPAKQFALTFVLSPSGRPGPVPTEVSP